MSVTIPAYKVTRWSVVGMEGMWAKMWDPPTASPATPDNLLPTNPVPEVMAAAGFQNVPSKAHTVQRDLLHGMKLLTWDGKKQLQFFLFADGDNPTASGGTYPAPTIRVPRGVIYHAETSGKGPPPHTIHWHGIEPTPMNDGVGHCSMELGHYTYKWQPNFIGTYFYHCHRNTMQHFEFGLFGLLLIEPPDAYFATQVLGAAVAPIGFCRDGLRRTAANLTNINGTVINGALTTFPNFSAGLLTDLDPWAGNPLLKFPTDPHAMTVAYDVEALWVLDDRDSVWSDLAPNAFTTYPKTGSTPGVNDLFNQNPGSNGFFAFNDFNADYWFVTGIPVPAPKGGTAAIPGNLVIPPQLNSGVTGTQISISALVGQTILIRCLDAAYNSTNITFPMDVVIIAWDGRALGQPPYGHNEAYLVPAGTPIKTSTARRFDALIRTTATMPVDSFVTVQFVDTNGQNIPGFEDLLCTAQIPIHIGPAVAGATFSLAGSVTDPAGAAMAGVAMSIAPVSQGGSPAVTVVTNATGIYSTAGLLSGMYSVSPTLAGYSFTPQMTNVTINGANVAGQIFKATLGQSVILNSNVASPQAVGTAILFTATANGGTAPYEYRFYVNDGSGTGFVLQGPYSANNIFTWTPVAARNYDIFVEARSVGSKAFRDSYTAINGFEVKGSLPATSVTLKSNLTSPQGPGAPITFTAIASGGAGAYEYRFYLNNGVTGFVLQAPYSAVNTFVWTPAAAGNFDVFVETRNIGSTAFRDAHNAINSFQIKGSAPPNSVTLTSSLASPQLLGAAVTLTANAVGAVGPCEYRFYVNDGSGTGFVLQGPYSTVNTFAWTPAVRGNYDIFVEARSVGSLVFRDTHNKINFFQIL